MVPNLPFLDRKGVSSKRILDEQGPAMLFRGVRPDRKPRALGRKTTG